MIRLANCCRKVGILLLIVAIIGGSSAAWGLNTWTTAGSTGTVDDADVSIAVFSGSTVTVSSSVEVATLDMRYNITLSPSPLVFNKVTWAVRFRDNGASAQVILTLKRQSVYGGEAITLASFDSNNYLPSNSFLARFPEPCCEQSSYFDYFYVHYIEATLKKFNSTGNPGLSVIGLIFSEDPNCE